MKFNRTTLFALLMLLAYVPAVLLVSLHTHHAEGFAKYECDDCVHHRVHSGHIAPDTGLHLCLLCQFAQQSYFGTDEVGKLVVPQTLNNTLLPAAEQVLSVIGNISPSRAPPCF